MIKKVSHFTMHDALGHSVLRSKWLDWVEKNKGPGKFGAVTHYSWMVEGEEIRASIDIGKVLWHELPDASGFICFESGFASNNCYVLDIYGKQRYRLTVPWELTGYEVPHGAKMWFRSVGEHINGKFGVTAWIEYAGDFYFELNYHEGRFLWGKEIRF